MRKNFKFLILGLPFTFYLLPFLCFAQPLTSTELINRAKDFDGKAVTYAGEVIGDIMVRGDYGWVNVNDGVNAIGIWLSKELVKDIEYTGNFKAKGDVIEVAGIFQRSCLKHGGDLDIHAQGLRKIESGRKTPETLNPAKKNQVLILFAILCTVWILTLLKRR